MHVISRALADSANMRTWSFLIDVIAQSGKLAQNTDALDKFVSQAESRRWYRVSIDRFTGEVLNVQKEIISE
ncbi:MAG: hypothetical protein HC845_09115 [Akkermansiaceae bacterium]|nr:hypothetical protein [Akkermansiaceae bacterium]